MILKDTRDLLRSVGRASVPWLAAELNAERAVVEESIRYLERRKAVVRMVVSPNATRVCGTRACGGCPLRGACSTSIEPDDEVEVFEWQKL